MYVDFYVCRRLFKNSWGDWRKDGHAFISIDDMKRLLKEDSEACLAVEHPIDSFVE